MSTKPDGCEDIPSDHPDYDRIVAMIERGNCPDCTKFGFDPGPRGGMSQNIFCRACGAGFNVAPWRPQNMRQRVIFVQRIGNRLRKVTP
jgi:hypothetical protein